MRARRGKWRPQSPQPYLSGADKIAVVIERGSRICPAAGLDAPCSLHKFYGRRLCSRMIGLIPVWWQSADVLSECG